MSGKHQLRKYHEPDGSEKDWAFVFGGRDLSVAKARQKERELETNPNNLASRLLLLGFYGCRSAVQDNYFTHMLWMIDERPGDHVSSYLGFEYHSRAVVWTKKIRRQATERWKVQIEMHPKDASILCNAASFFRSTDQQTISEQLYKRAKKVDNTLGLPARKLAYQYRKKASTATKAEQRKLIRLALQEADVALERRDYRGEKIEILRSFTPTAIKYGYLTQARKYAKRLQYYGDGFWVWGQYAYLYLAWLDLRERRFRGLNFKLKRLRKLFRANPSYVASCNSALSLVNDALTLGEQSMAQEILRLLIFGSRTEEYKERMDELEEWLAAIKQNRKPKSITLLKKLELLI